MKKFNVKKEVKQNKTSSDEIIMSDFLRISEVTDSTILYGTVLTM
jgi:hypothetical protein